LPDHDHLPGHDDKYRPAGRPDREQRRMTSQDIETSEIETSEIETGEIEAAVREGSDAWLLTGEQFQDAP
jgi:hypothetical protein